MSVLVTTGAKCMCSFGTVLCSLQVTSQMTNIVEGKALATIQDMKPGVNITGFGMCSSLANPAVASATAAAFGVLTPQPCTMMPVGTWVPTNPQVMISGIPCLTNESTLVCGCGVGNVKIISPGQSKALI